MRLPLVTDAIKEGRISELPRTATVEYVAPELPAWRRYTTVELLQSVHVHADGEASQLVSFVLGKRASDNRWDIISAAVRDDDGTWRELQVKQPTGAPG